MTDRVTRTIEKGDLVRVTAAERDRARAIEFLARLVSDGAAALAVVGAVGCPANAPNPDRSAPPAITPSPATATAPTPTTVPSVESKRAPSPGPGPAAAPRPSGVAALAQDMAIIREGRNVLVSSGQCSAGPAWASEAEWADDKREPIRTGEILHVITNASVERWKAHADAHTVTATTTAATPSQHDGILLATMDVAPSPKAQLESRQLTKVGKDAATIAAWVEKEAKFAVRPAGQIEGAFGDGIDRVVLFEPKRWDDPAYPEEASRRSELAVLVARGVPKGWLPFGVLAAAPGAGWDEGASGLQVLGVVDIDGDGVQEIVWLTQYMGVDAFRTGVELSYFGGAAGFQTQMLGACNYTGCDAFVPREQCRGRTKPKMP